MVGGTFGREALLTTVSLRLGVATELVRRHTGDGCRRCGRPRSLPTPHGTVVPPSWLRAVTYAAATVPLAASRDRDFRALVGRQKARRRHRNC